MINDNLVPTTIFAMVQSLDGFIEAPDTAARQTVIRRLEPLVCLGAVDLSFAFFTLYIALLWSPS